MPALRYITTSHGRKKLFGDGCRNVLAKEKNLRSSVL
jgi:hypothetical protein